MTTLLLSLLPALWAWDPLPSAPSTLDALEFLRHLLLYQKAGTPSRGATAAARKRLDPT